MAVYNPTFRLTYSRMLVTYIIVFFLLCWFDFQFIFFSDSKDYVAFGSSYSNSGVHKYLLRIWPDYYYATSFMVLGCVLYLAREIHWAFLILLLNPYYLLLIFTATKEQLIFIGLFFAFVNLKSLDVRNRWPTLFLALGSAPLLSMRTAYVPFFIANFFVPSNKFKPVDIVYLLGIMVILALGFTYFEKIAAGIEFLQSRSTFSHVGRDYFPGLCLADKAETVPFITCWINSRFGIVFHNQFFSFNYFVHLGFLASFWFGVYLAFKFERPFGLMVVVGILAYHLLGTWWGPVQGAAERYFAPILWCVYLLAYGRVLRSGYPKEVQWKFRADALKRRARFTHVNALPDGVRQL